MTNSMPSFTVLVNKVVLGRVSAVSHGQAMKRARVLAEAEGYTRFEIIAEGNVNLDRKAGAKAGYVDYSYNKGRARYETPGFEDRRAALIAAYKAQ